MSDRFKLSGLSTWMRRAALALALLGVPTAAVLNASPAAATTVLQVDVPAMAKTSEWVVRVRVTAIASVDLRGEGQGIYTDVSLTIEQVYRGLNAPKTYVMRLIGGLGKDGMALTIPGMPKFSVGEEAVLFLEKTGIGHVPCGLGQGVWRVFRSPIAPAIVSQSTAGIHLMARGPNGAITSAPESGPKAKTLIELEAEIRAVPVVVAPSGPGTVAP